MSGTSPKAWERWHAWSLVGTAACIPVSEKLGWIGLAGVMVCLAGRLRQGRQTQAHPMLSVRPMLIGWGVWLGCGLGAVGWGGYGWLRPSELTRGLPWLAMPGVVWSMGYLPRIWLKRIAQAFVAALLVAACVGVCQYYFDARPFEALLHWDTSVGSQARVPEAYERSVAGGFYFHRLKLAHVLLVGLGIGVARQLCAHLSWRRRGWEGLGLGVGVLALLLTFTRGAFGGLAGGVLVCGLITSGRWRWMVLGLVALVALGVLALPMVRHRLGSATGADATSERAWVWSQGVAVIADHPWGIGLGNYSRVIERYYDQIDPNTVMRTYPHNILLAAWAETGPVGMLAYAWAWFAGIGVCIPYARRAYPQSVRAAAATGLFVGTAFWIVGISHDVFFHAPVALAYAGLWGWLWSYLEGIPLRERLG